MENDHPSWTSTVQENSRFEWCSTNARVFWINSWHIVWDKMTMSSPWSLLSASSSRTIEHKTDPLFYMCHLKHENKNAHFKRSSKESLAVNDGGEPENPDSLFLGIRPILVIGKVFGLVSLKGLFQSQESSVRFEFKSFGTFLNLICCLTLTANVALSFIDLFQKFAGSGGGNASEIATASQNPLFYLMGFFVYVFFLFNSRKITSLLTSWTTVSQSLHFKATDTGLRKSIRTTAGILFSSAILQSILYHLHVFPVFGLSGHSAHNERHVIANSSMSSSLHTDLVKGATTISVLETYYYRSHPFWAVYFSYHPVLGVLLFFTGKLGAFASNYVDVLVISFSRALYFKFKVLVEQVEADLIQVRVEINRIASPFQSATKKRGTWAQVRRDHLTLCKLLNDVEGFLSPLVFLSYGMNIYFVCLQLHSRLTPTSQRTTIESINSAWSFVHVIGRLVTVSIVGAKVNDFAHQIGCCIQKCSMTEYCVELERLERMLGTTQIGLTGMGCFVITRAFMLVVVSVIFTFEIVLLQASATTLSPTIAIGNSSTVSQ